jgi:hypothetical protein
MLEFLIQLLFSLVLHPIIQLIFYNLRILQVFTSPLLLKIMLMKQQLTLLLNLYFNSHYFTLVERVVPESLPVDILFVVVLIAVVKIVGLIVENLFLVELVIIRLRFLNLEALVLFFFFLSLISFLS